MLTKRNETALGMNGENCLMISIVLDKYVNIIYYHKNLTCPDHLVDYKKKSLRLKASKFCFIHQGLVWRNLKGWILRCVDSEESKKPMDEFHKGLCGGKYAARKTTHKTLRGSYYWPTIFIDVHKF